MRPAGHMHIPAERSLADVCGRKVPASATGRLKWKNQTPDRVLEEPLEKLFA